LALAEAGDDLTVHADIPSVAAIWQWLLLPMSGAHFHHVAPQVAWHGRIMVLALGLLLPIMIVIARYYKVVPGQDWPRYLDNPFWFLTHRRAGYWVTILATCGVITVAWKNHDLHPLSSLHGVIGWSVLLLSWFQVMGSRARGTHGGPMNPFTRQPRPPEEWPGDHFSMTRTRIVFEYTHKTLGWLLFLAAIIAIISGLYKADAPRWMWIAMLLWWTSAAIVVVVLQTQGRCIDSYQAIWGINPSLTGNRRKPIGWGVRRYTDSTLGTAPWPRRRK
jgi:hypothetical protein